MAICTDECSGRTYLHWTLPVRLSSLTVWVGGFIMTASRQALKFFLTDQTDVEKAFEPYLSGELDDRPELGCDRRHEK